MGDMYEWSDQENTCVGIWSVDLNKASDRYYYYNYFSLGRSRLPIGANVPLKDLTLNYPCDN